MDQVCSLEHAINLARRILVSGALWTADQDKGKELLGLLGDSKGNIKIIKTHADYFERMSTVPKKANYFKDYEQGIRMYEEMANTLNQLMQELKTD